MQHSIPKFENKEALEQYLDNLKLQLLNSEFANLCNIEKEPTANNNQNNLEKVPFLIPNTNFDPHSFLKDLQMASLNGKEGEPTGLQNARFFTSEQSGADIDVSQNFLLQSNFTFGKPAENQQAQDDKDALTKARPEEAKTDNQDFVNSSTQTQTTNGVTNQSDSQSGEIFSKEHANTANSFKTQGVQTVYEQNINGVNGSLNGFGKPKLIQPIYVMYSNNQVGYIEVDLNDEVAMKNISQFLSPPPAN